MIYKKIREAIEEIQQQNISSTNIIILASYGTKEILKKELVDLYHININNSKNYIYGVLFVEDGSIEDLVVKSLISKKELNEV